MRLKKKNSGITHETPPPITVWAEKYFPPGYSYWIPDDGVHDLHNELVTRLDIKNNRRSGNLLWGAQAETLSKAGTQIAWVPDDLVPVFFTWTVHEELARACAVVDGSLSPSEIHDNLAYNLMQQLTIGHLSAQAPDRLSDGESKLLVLALQWAKKARWLFFDSLTRSFSDSTIEMILSLFSSAQEKPVLIFGNMSSGSPWLEPLSSLGSLKMRTLREIRNDG
ncbi:hypothetical protein KAR48_11290 [bacterium]|nr:hypothetical protein [bacterium]